MIYVKPRTYVEELFVVWTPHRDAPSLLGEGYRGSTLTDCGRETRDQVRYRKDWDRRRRAHIRGAKRDFAYYRGQW